MDSKKNDDKGNDIITRKMIINGYNVTLNFLPESDGKTIDAVKKILISSQHQVIPDHTG